MINESTSYKSVCENVLNDMKTKLPADVSTDVHDILCVGDAAEEMTVILNMLELNDIVQVVSSFCIYHKTSDYVNNLVGWAIR